MCKYIFFLSLVIVCGVATSNAGGIDIIPGLANIKANLLRFFGFDREAQQTLYNLNHGPIISAFRNRSLGIPIDKEKTKTAINEKLLIPLVDGTPVAGHVHGLILKLEGNDTAGDQAIRSASRSTAVLAGGLAGGPTGALDGAILFDLAMTAHDNKTSGFIEYIANAKNSSASEKFDQLVDVALTGAVGVGGEGDPVAAGAVDVGKKEASLGAVLGNAERDVAKNEAPKIFGMLRRRSGRVCERIHSLEDTFENINLNDLGERGNSEPHIYVGEGNPVEPMDISPGLLNPQVSSHHFNFHSSRSSSMSSISSQHNMLDKDVLHIVKRKILSKSESAQIQKQRKNIENIIEESDITDMEVYRGLHYTDFATINDVKGEKNCYLCTLAGIRSTTVSKLLLDGIDMSIFKGIGEKLLSLDELANLYKHNIEGSTLEVFDYQPAFAGFLDGEASSQHILSYPVAYEYTDSSGNMLGHVKLVRTWEDQEGEIMKIYIDYQKPVESRFSITLDPVNDNNIKRVFVVLPGKMSMFLEKNGFDALNLLSKITSEPFKKILPTEMGKRLRRHSL